MESNQTEDSNSLTGATDDITRRLLRSPLHPSPSQKLRSHDSWRVLANSMKFESNYQEIAKLEDYLDLKLLAAVSAKIGGRRAKMEDDNSTSTEMMMKKKRVDFDFEWPVDELKSSAMNNNAAVNLENVVALKRRQNKQ